MRCAQCAFYSPLDKNSGECRESPPKVFPVPIRTLEGGGIGFQPVFPRVLPDCWCGMFEDADEVKDVPTGAPMLLT